MVANLSTSPPPVAPAAPPPPPRASASSASSPALGSRSCAFLRLLERLQSAGDSFSSDFRLPTIVAVGHAGSGKSSVLERVARLPLFPIGSTRVPLRVLLRHATPAKQKKEKGRDEDEEGDEELMPSRGAAADRVHVKIRLEHLDGQPSVETSASYAQGAVPFEQLRATISKWMDRALEMEKETHAHVSIMKHVVTVEVCSPNVPNLELVDLPGIVGGRLPGDPEDIMEQTRALAERYISRTDTIVLAVVPASEQPRNSQAFEMVQRLGLIDKTIGVMTMVDLVPRRPGIRDSLASVKARLDGTASDCIKLKHGYVAVLNRDSESSHQSSIDAFDAIENAFMQEHMQSYVERGLASCSTLTKKLDAMFEDYVSTKWLPKALARIDEECDKISAKLDQIGSSGQGLANQFHNKSPTVRRKQMLRILECLLPKLMTAVDGEMFELMGDIHNDFLGSREELKIVLRQIDTTTDHPSMMASMLILEAYKEYIQAHLSDISKNIALRLILLVRDIIGEREESGDRPSSLHLERFRNLYLFFASSVWDQLNELLVDEEELGDRIMESFFRFDRSEAHHFGNTNASSKSVLAELAGDLEGFLERCGYQNAGLHKVFSSEDNVAASWAMDRATARQILKIGAPTAQVQSEIPSAPFSWFNPKSVHKPRIFGGEFEGRLLFALGQHVITPFLRAISDVADLERQMHAYVRLHQEVEPNEEHFFHEGSSESRAGLQAQAERLKAVKKELENSRTTA